MRVKNKIKISEILQAVSQRPYTIPNKQWMFYQEWHDTLFLHWEFPVEVVRPLVPQPLEIDTINGLTYVSLVAFTVENGRLFCTPAIPSVSKFHEVNIRVYVCKNGKPGIYFLSVEASEWLSALAFRLITGIPYEHAAISRKNHFSAVNKRKNFRFNVDYIVQPKTNKTELDFWLTERYALYQDIGKKIFRYDIHHVEWPVENVDVKDLVTDYRFPTFNLSSKPAIMHYSKGVQVVAWNKISVV